MSCFRWISGRIIRRLEDSRRGNQRQGMVNEDSVIVLDSIVRILNCVVNILPTFNFNGSKIRNSLFSKFMSPFLIYFQSHERYCWNIKTLLTYEYLGSHLVPHDDVKWCQTPQSSLVIPIMCGKTSISIHYIN